MFLQKSSKRTILFITFLAVLVITVIVFSRLDRASFNTEERNKLQLDLRLKIEEVSKSGEFLYLDSVTPFSWDIVHIFGPYTSLETVNAKLDFRWDYAKRINIESRDDIWLIVFVDDKQVIQFVEYYRYADFTNEEGNTRSYSLTRDKAVFKVVKKEIDGNSTLRMVPKVF